MLPANTRWPGRRAYGGCWSIEHEKADHSERLPELILICRATDMRRSPSAPTCAVGTIVRRKFGRFDPLLNRVWDC
jgi:hypothetical protein